MLSGLKKIEKSMLSGILSAGFSVLTLIVFCIYGLVYDYFDLAVFLMLLAAAALMALYVLLQVKAAQLFNLISVFLISCSFALFFLNSYPVWADRLNNIKMYGSRGTLVPVILLIVMFLISTVTGIVSCFQKEK